MPDNLVRIGNTLVQQGDHDERISVIELARDDIPWVIDRLKDIAVSNGYSKISLKVPESELSHFKSKGYTIEAMIPRFFQGREDGYFLARYLQHCRKREIKKVQIQQVLRKAITLACSARLPMADYSGLEFRVAEKSDAGELSKLYNKVSDMSMLHAYDEGYLRKTMEEDVRYYYIRSRAGIISVIAAEIDYHAKTVEITDPATDLYYSGKGQLQYLLRMVEKEVLTDGIKLSYSMTRSLSYPVNSLFTRAGYFYSGRLVNYSNVCGGFESMNVWYKPLGKKSL